MNRREFKAMTPLRKMNPQKLGRFWNYFWFMTNRISPAHLVILTPPLVKTLRPEREYLKGLQHWVTTFSSCQMIWSVKLQLTWRIVYSVIIAAPVDCPKSSLFPDTILGEIHKSLPIFWGHCAGKRIWNWIKRWVHRSRDMLCTKWHRVKRCIVADPKPDHIAKGNLGSFLFSLD